MKIKDLYTPGRTVFSLEVFPPNKNFPIETVYEAIEGLAAINPAYISVTYGAGGNKNYAVHGRKNLDDVMVILFLMYAVDLVAEHFEMVP